MTIKIDPNLTQHSVLIVCQRREKAIPIESSLKKLGYQTFVAIGLYDSLKLIPQEMPHLVVADAILSDGTAGHLYDKMKADPALARIPIMILILRKSKDEMAVITNRRFADFFTGNPDPVLVTAKIKNTIEKFSPISPFALSFDKNPNLSDVTLTVDASLIGKSNDQIIAKSPVEVSPITPIICVNKTLGKDPAILKMGANLKFGDYFHNVFPLSRVSGKARQWLDQIPDLKLDTYSHAMGVDNMGEKPMRKVLFFDPQEARFQGFNKILSGYFITLIHAPSIQEATKIMKSEAKNLSGIYLHELPSTAEGTEWKNSYIGLSSKDRPSVIIGTKNSNLKGNETIRFLKQPFGMGVLVDMMETNFVKSANIQLAINAMAMNNLPETPISLEVPGKIIALDETGGVMEIRAPLVKNGKLCLKNPTISKFLDISSLPIVASSIVNEQQDIWQIRFNSVVPGLSKSKYWEKISKSVSEFNKSVEKVA